MELHTIHIPRLTTQRRIIKMIECGIEEPIVNNEALLFRKARDKIIGLDASAGFAINRYSIVPKSVADAEQVADEISNVLTHCGQPYAIRCWQKYDPARSSVQKVSIRSQVKKKHLQKEKWMVAPRESHFVAQRKIERAGTEIVLGNSPLVLYVPEDMNGDDILLTSDSSAFVAQSGYFVLDEPTLEALQDSNNVLIYGCKDSIGNRGAVILSVQKLCFFDSCPDDTNLKLRFGQRASDVFV